MKTRLCLLSLAVLLTLAALPKPAAAARCIPGYCWIVSADVTCCYEDGCVIVCG